MTFKFEDRYRRDMPQTIGETDSVFDCANYCEWLEKRILEMEAGVVVPVMTGEEGEAKARSLGLDPSLIETFDEVGMLIRIGYKLGYEAAGATSGPSGQPIRDTAFRPSSRVAGEGEVH